MKKKEIIQKNYLEKIPMRPSHIKWDADESGAVTLHIENKGAIKRLTQIILKKPEVSHIHLDETGSFVWQIMDGEKDMIAIGEEVKMNFGESAEPLYPRLAKFFKMLDSYGFVSWKK